MNISEKFDQQPWTNRLARRRDNFKIMCEHVWRESLRKGPSCHIVETGTAWDENNFEGQGLSTLVWDWVASEVGITVYSIDIRPEASQFAKKHTRKVTYLIGDSISELSKSSFANNTCLLYLDSYDWTPDLNLESSAHHLMELAAVYSSLPKDCMVVVDDRHGDMKGKHWLVESFMAKVGVPPVFRNHQIGWIKP